MKIDRLPPLPPRIIRPRLGESRRDAELRWQAKADPAIAAHAAAGRSKGEIASRVGVSPTAIINALRRFGGRRKNGAR